jgi:hypothetical protein
MSRAVCVGQFLVTQTRAVCEGRRPTDELFDNGTTSKAFSERAKSDTTCDPSALRQQGADGVEDEERGEYQEHVERHLGLPAIDLVPRALEEHDGALAEEHE